MQKFMEISLRIVIACTDMELQITNQTPIFLAISPFLLDQVTYIDVTLCVGRLKEFSGLHIWYYPVAKAILLLFCLFKCKINY